MAQQKYSQEEKVTHISLRGLRGTRLKNDLLEIIEDLNKLFKKHDLTVSICHINLQMELEDEELGNFFFFPTHKIYEYDGIVEKHIGYRMWFVKRKKNSELKVFIFNIWNEMLKSGEWMKTATSEGFKLKRDKVDFNKLLEVVLKYNEIGRKVFTTTVGWIQGNKDFQYVPITNYSEDNVGCHKDTLQLYNFATLKEYDSIESFKKMWELLNVTDKKITIPLISYTVLMSFHSLIKLHNKEHPNFILNICGNNGKNKEALVNLFCNIYNRTEHIFTLDSTLHANQSMKYEIPEKARKIRDAIFISRIEKQGDLKTYLKILGQNSVPNGILLISNDMIQHDDVINIDTSGAFIEENILQFHKSNPLVFSTWFDSSIRYIQKTLEDKHWGLKIKGNLDSLYKAFSKEITNKKGEFDPNKLRHYTWLLVGFSYFLNHGLQANAIDVEALGDSFNEATAIFYKYSAIEIGEKSNNNEEVFEKSQLEKDALAFINAIDKLLKDTDLICYEEASTLKEPELGWISKNRLYLKNEEVYSKANNYLANLKVELKSKKIDIYKFLLEQGVIAEKPGSGWGIQVTGNVKAVCYSLQHMREFLLDNGYSLNFLESK